MTKNPNLNKKHIKSIEKLLVESLEAAVKLGDLLIDDPQYSVKVSKILELKSEYRENSSKSGSNNNLRKNS